MGSGGEDEGGAAERETEDGRVGVLVPPVFSFFWASRRKDFIGRGERRRKIQ
jgi:hypothetical protein